MLFPKNPTSFVRVPYLPLVLSIELHLPEYSERPNECVGLMAAPAYVNQSLHLSFKSMVAMFNSRRYCR
jgi:hypothetical protein